MDRISINSLRVEAHVGVTDEERARLQPVRFDIEVLADLRPAGRSDDLADTVDYARVASVVAETARKEPSRLIEHLAEKAADAVSTMPRVLGVTVEVTKEVVPLDEDVGKVSVRIRRPA
jgi:dihydroneopterin aldolase